MDSVNYFPPEWNDDKRIRVLMTAMPSDKNSVAYQSRMNFWSCALNRWLIASRKFSFNLRDAQEAFLRGNIPPLCLPEVLQNLIRQSELIYFEDFKKYEGGRESWKIWSQRILTSPVVWSWNKLRESIGTKGIENSVMISCRVTKEMSDKILSFWWQHRREPNSVCRISDVFLFLKDFVLTMEDLTIILHFLAKLQKVDISVQDNETYIKFSKPGNLDVPSISQTEIAELKLLKTEEMLNERLATVHKKSSDLRQEAKKLLSIGKKKQALSLLRSKQKLEKSLENITSSLENVSTLLLQLQQSKLNLEILDSLQIGLNTLKSTLSCDSMADVSETMDAIQEALDDCAEVSNAMAFSVSDDDVSDDLLEKELESLMANATLRDSHKEDEFSLPEVPKNDPLPSTKFPNKLNESFLSEY